MSLLAFPPGEPPQEQCTRVNIVSDGILEDEEIYCISLESTEPQVTIGSVSATCIVIEDIDTVVVNWQQSQYSTSEGRAITVCALQLNRTERSFTVNITMPDKNGK